MTSAAIVGSTGLVGSHILDILLSLPSISSVHSLARRELPATDAKLHAIISKDSSEWPSILSSITPTPSIFFSGLGTTRATAGGVDNQRKIDYDLNLALARAAKESGVKVYVLISAQAASATSSLALPKMKGELEDSIMALEFETTVILRPGLILGAREESRPVEAAARMIAGFVGLLGNVFKDPWAQNADVIGRAAIKSGLQALEGKAEKVWIVRQSDIVKLGRTE